MRILSPWFVVCEALRCSVQRGAALMVHQVLARPRIVGDRIGLAPGDMRFVGQHIEARKMTSFGAADDHDSLRRIAPTPRPVAIGGRAHGVREDSIESGFLQIGCQ